MKGHTGWVNSVDFSPDSKRIVSGGDEKSIFVWNAETGVKIDIEFEGHSDGVTSVCFSTDGKKIASGSYD